MAATRRSDASSALPSRVSLDVNSRSFLSHAPAARKFLNRKPRGKTRKYGKAHAGRMALSFVFCPPRLSSCTDSITSHHRHRRISEMSNAQGDPLTKTVTLTVDARNNSPSGISLVAAVWGRLWVDFFTGPNFLIFLYREPRDLRNKSMES